jgi:hypothetical protein
VSHRVALLSALVAVALGCAEHGQRAQTRGTNVFELANYPFERRGYEGLGSSIREIDPNTLAPRTRRGLRLGGYTERWVFSPDRREAAFGLEFGELVIVDLPKMELRARLRLGSPDVIVRPIGWPRPDLLFALVCRDAGKYGCFDNRLLLIDPKGPRQYASFELNGVANGAFDQRTRQSVVFVAPERLHPARLLIAEQTGAIHEVQLTKLLVGQTAGRFPHERYAWFGLDRGRARVIGTRGVVAEVSLQSRRVRYHRVAGLAVSRKALQRARAEPWTGTMNPFSDENVDATKAWPGILLVASSESELGNRGRTVRRVTTARFLDTTTWTARPARSPYGQPAAGVLLVATGSIDERAKRYRGPFALLAYERSGTVRYRLDFDGPFTESAYGDWLYVGKIDGRKTRVYDARTGKLLRRIPATDVEPAFSWSPPS